MFRRWANDCTGEARMVEFGSCSNGFGHLEPALQPWRHTVTVGQSAWTLLPAQQTLRVATTVIRAQPTITHCGNPQCDRYNDAIVGGPILTEHRASPRVAGDVPRLACA
jgi:aminoglycoside 3-N-acetyltransferase